MFDQRIKGVLLILGFAASVAVARVVQLQVLEGERHREFLEETLTHEPVEYLPFERGAITDRHGQVLVEDAPAWDICVHYGVLNNQSDYLSAQANAALKRAGIRPTRQRVRQERGRLQARIEHGLWAELSRITGVSQAEILAERDRICQHVEAVSRWLARKTGVDMPVLEERMSHAVVRDVNHEAMLAVRELRSEHPWIEIRPGTRRIYYDAEPFAHLLGRVGRATKEDIEADPNPDDPQKRYRPNETIGKTGAERMLERQLRGRYGCLQADSREEPVRGHDAALTIDGDLQREVYALLRDAVARVNRQNPFTSPYPTCPGGSVVVLYMPPHMPGQPPRREILALVSYPSYDPVRFNENYLELVRDSWRIPTSFRAAYQTYPAGSIVKPVVLAAALSENKVDPHRLFICTGTYKKKKCWVLSRASRAHPEPLDAQRSLKHSCNVYYYRLGELLGPDSLAVWYERFGFGHRPGTGLGAEENAGVVAGVAGEPPAGRGDVLNLAIGQGPIAITPLQAANEIATVATGEFVPVTLTLDEAEEHGARRLPVSSAHWRVIRNGLWRVVNDTNPHGAASRYARLDSTEYELCGKTGSAQFLGWRRAVRFAYKVSLPDGRIETIIDSDPTGYAVEKRLRRDYPSGQVEIIDRRIHALHPNQNAGRPDTHAWFVGYIQDKVRGSATPRIAIAVNLEFAGSGGKLAAPVARDVAKRIIESPRDYLGGGRRGAALGTAAVQSNR